LNGEGSAFVVERSALNDSLRHRASTCYLNNAFLQI
jgi:hypothetical protein